METVVETDVYLVFGSEPQPVVSPSPVSLVLVVLDVVVLMHGKKDDVLYVVEERHGQFGIHYQPPYIRLNSVLRLLLVLFYLLVPVFWPQPLPFLLLVLLLFGNVLAVHRPGSIMSPIH